MTTGLLLVILSYSLVKVMVQFGAVIGGRSTMFVPLRVGGGEDGDRDLGGERREIGKE